jgi:unsaturated chondroitin disaccharide hydrolase
VKKNLIIFLGLALIFSACSSPKESMSCVIKKGLDRAAIQSKKMAEKLINDKTKLPRSTDEQGNLTTSDSKWWTSGFFPGTLWYLYEATGDSLFKIYAKEYTKRIESEQYTTNNHDVGFMLYCSYGNGFRITKDQSYKSILLKGAESLSTRFNKNVGLIRSWDDHKDKWDYPVIIDNMMNLELLCWASKNSNSTKYLDIAVKHADKTLKNHFRNDYSSFHVVSYDTISGRVAKKNTNQGYADNSSWARGQAWGLYGFTMMYRETEDLKYLLLAENIAKYLLNHPNLPEDKIPYWDYNAPDIPNAKRDASAAAIMASAFIDLSQLTKDKTLSENCLSTSETILRTLTSDEYLAKAGTNGFFVLKHSVGNMPIKREIDAPLSYADYYYIEALLKLKKLLN